MLTYRVYTSDSTGKYVEKHTIQALDDLDACRQAQALCGEGQNAELWKGVIRLAKVKPRPKHP